MQRWIEAWGGASILGIVNGAIREFAYKDRLGERQANQLSALTLASLLALYFGLLQRRWPLATTRDALSIGAIWGAMTVIFEFGFGHYVSGDSWEELLEAYDIRKGNVWPLVLLSILAGPPTARGISDRWEEAVLLKDDVREIWAWVDEGMGPDNGGDVEL